jgi:uncharacterized protein YndB with AHSA1/START domain
MLDSTEHESSGEFLGASRTELALERRRGTGGSRIEITLKAVPEGTGLTFVHSRLHDEETRRSHEAGWTGSLDKLEAHFAAGTAA